MHLIFVIFTIIAQSISFPPPAIKKLLQMMNVNQSFVQPYGNNATIIAEFPAWTAVFNNSYRLDIQISISNRIDVDPKNFRFCITSIVIEHSVPGMQVYPMKNRTWHYSTRWSWQWPKTRIYFVYMYSQNWFEYLNGNTVSEPFEEYVKISANLLLDLSVRFGQ